MGEQGLVELSHWDLALLEDVGLEQGSVDVFPFIAELKGEISVEWLCSLLVHRVQSNRGMRLGFAHARDTLLEILAWGLELIQNILAIEVVALLRL